MAALPLTGLRVLDFTNTYAGPTCGRVLADLGAEVIHVEAPQRIDYVRLLILAENDASGRYWERGGYFMARNLGKQGLTLDLTRPDGVAAFRRLTLASDIVLESWAPRVMRSFGLAYDQLAAERPDLIYCSLSGYGQAGPYRDWVAFGMGLEPASGVSQLTGYAGGPPLRSGISLTDPFTGLAAAAAVLMALRHRARTGTGQYIDLSEQEAALPLVAEALLDAQMNDRLTPRRGNRSAYAAPQGVYPCAGEDAWVALSCHNDAEFERLCKAMGHPEWLDDERFADVLARHEHHDALDALITAWTRGRDKLTAMADLQAAGVRAAAVLHGKDLLENDHLRARALFDVVDHAEVGRRPYPRQLPVHFSAFEAGAQGPAPLLGEHNDAILRDLAGLSDADIAALREAKIVGETPEPLFPTPMVKAIAEHPMDTLLDVGAVLAVEPDYRQRLGLDATTGQPQP